MFEKGQHLCSGFDGEVEVGKKSGGEGMAVSTQLCLLCPQWEDDSGSGLVDMRDWEAEGRNLSAGVRA